MTLLESIVDPDYTGGSYQGKSLYDNITGVPGALVITEGTYNTNCPTGHFLYKTAFFILFVIFDCFVFFDT